MDHPLHDTPREVAADATTGSPSHVQRANAETSSGERAQRKQAALDAVTAAIREAKKPGVEASQQEIADAVLKGMGLIFGQNPFVQGGDAAGWGGVRSTSRR